MDTIYKVFISAVIMVSNGIGQVTLEATYPLPDERFKTDILLVLAHPDDETAIGSYLAKLVFDDGKRVSAVYSNRGQGGGNSIGVEQSEALGAIREIEVRRAMAKFGVTNLWFLDGDDTPGQDVFHSLHNLRHGAALEKLVRIIRLTRPEVIITWLPHHVSGENHGDHQASGVLAVEAFDLAGNPIVFPTQTAVARDRMDILNFNDGLRPWQTKKLYFFSDRETGISAPGPDFDIKTISRAKGVPYYELAASLHVEHKVQGEVAVVGADVLNEADIPGFIDWLSRYNVIFGKSHVRAQPVDPIFSGINDEVLEFQPASGFKAKKHRGISMDAGGTHEFYRNFMRAHDMDHLVDLVEPEIMVSMGSYLHHPLIIRNNTRKSVRFTLKAQVPEGWNLYSGQGEYVLNPGEHMPVQTMIQCPWEELDSSLIEWQLWVGGKQIANSSLKVKLVEWNLPQ
ncbi:MAG: PIG-L family deacetylase [Candidatus Marinimicrobia bacterium]|nr:PIG-L family deacetylase [Candidatus Neomarinimicrobiota bacterium]MCF7850928.1 PIG-L family deacetylase [Candidatus Neomarinimicrobiota bacterium]